MALVSYTQSAAGEPMQFTMNKNDLLSVPKVMADPFFSLESNWFRVSFVFKHTTSGKRFVPSFRTFTNTKYLRVRSGMNGGDGFELKKIIISKSDRTFLVIKTSEIPSVANYVFSLMGSGGGVQNFVFDNSLKDSSITLTNNGLTATRTSSGSYSYVSSLLNREVSLSSNDKLYFEITVNNTASSGVDAFGFVFNTVTPTTFGSNNLTLPGFPSNEPLRVMIQGSTIYKQSPSIGIQSLQGGFGFENNAKLGVAVDVAARTFFFVKNGIASNTFSFADVVGSSTKLYFGVGPYYTNDQYSINSTPVHLPSGYTSAVQYSSGSGSSGSGSSGSGSSGSGSSGGGSNGGGNSSTFSWNTSGKTGSGGVTAGPDGEILKTSGGSGYNVNVLSTESISDGQAFEFTLDTKFLNVILGVATEADPNGAYSSFKFGVYNAVGGYEMIANGNTIGGMNVNFTVGDVVKFQVSGSSLIFHVNGVSRYTYALPSSAPLYALVTIYSENKGVFQSRKV